MTRIIDEAMRRLYPDEHFPKHSILRVEFLVPKKWTNRIVQVAGRDNDPFEEMRGFLQAFLEDEVELIKFEIDD